MIFSVVVCTYNRANMLANVLNDLAQQEISGEDYEVLIVDNGSSDQTALVAKEFCTRHQNFHYFCEENVGLSYARNRGLVEARSDYIAYTDDDCRISPTWLSKAKTIAQNIKPEIFGGPWLPFYTVLKPVWYQDKYDTYAEGNYPKTAGFQKKLLPSGANVFYRRDMLISLGGFNLNLGMIGNTLGYEEETEAQRRILSSVPHSGVYFDPDLFVQHWVRPTKMNVAWKYKQQYALGRAKARVKADADPSFRRYNIVKLCAITIAVVGYLLISPFRCLMRNRLTYPYVQNFYYEAVAKSFFELGYRVERYLLSLTG